MNLAELRAALEAKQSELRTIHESAGDRALNAEEQARWDATEAEERDIQSGIAEAEAREAREAAVAERRAKWGTTQVAPVKPEDPFDLRDMRRMDDDQLIARAKMAFEDKAYRGRRVPDAHIEEVLRKIEDIPGVAEHALIHGSKAYRSGWETWFKASVRNQSPIFTGEEAEALRAALSLTSANGGYTLPTLLDPTLIKTGAVTKNPIRNISRVETGTQDKWNGVTAGNVTTYWKAEGSAFTDGSPTFGATSVDAAMLTAYVTASFEIFQDSNLQAQIPALIGDAIDMAEGVAFVSGSGSDAPKGVITAVSGTAGSLVTVTTRGSFTSASAVDTQALLNAVATRYEDSSTFVMNKATWRTIDMQVIGTYGYKVTDLADRNSLFGSPLVRASSITATTTSGNILAVYGDFSQFLIYDRIGVQVEFIQNVVDGSGLPTGQRGLIAYKRVGSDVTDVNAFRLLKA